MGTRERKEILSLKPSLSEVKTESLMQKIQVRPLHKNRLEQSWCVFISPRCTQIKQSSGWEPSALSV